MQIAGYPAPTKPLHSLDLLTENVTFTNGKTVPILKHLRSRLEWYKEEIEELAVAIEAGNIIECIDALCDIQYFNLGTAVVLGINLEPFFNEVHLSNMAKFSFCEKCHRQKKVDPDCKICRGTGYIALFRRGDLKLMKPDGWVPPNLSPILEAQRTPNG